MPETKGKKEGFAIRDPWPLVFIILSSLVLVLIIIFLGQDGGQGPEAPREQGEDAGIDGDVFAGRVLLNGEELALAQAPLLEKGQVYLPLLETAKALGMELAREGDMIFIGTAPAAPAGEGPRIYRDGTDITPADIIGQGQDYYVPAQYGAAVLGLNYYENFWANAVHLHQAGGELQDGKYVVVRSGDERGWAPELHVEILGGEVIACNYREVNEAGVDKFADPDYLDSWSSADSINPVALIRQMEAELVEGQAVTEVDVASGATGSWKNFIQLAAKALGKAQSGQLPRQYPPGEYVVLGAPGEHGWIPLLEYRVTGGEIAAFRFDEFNEKGERKRDSEEYMKRWREAFPDFDPRAALAEREGDLLKVQDPNLLDAITGATNWGVGLKVYGAGSLVHAAEAQLPQGSAKIYIACGPESERGDRAQLLLAVGGGEIFFADFRDFRNGRAKETDLEYLEAWREQHPDVDPVALDGEMEAVFLQEKNPRALDAISGATGWRESFQDLAARILEYIEGE